MIIVNSRLLHQLHPLSVALFFLSLLASVDVLTKNCIRLLLLLLLPTFFFSFGNFFWCLLTLLLFFGFGIDQIDDNYNDNDDDYTLFCDIYTDVTISE